MLNTKKDLIRVIIEEEVIIAVMERDNTEERAMATAIIEEKIIVINDKAEDGNLKSYPENFLV